MSDRREFVDRETAARIAFEYGSVDGADYGDGATPETDVLRPRPGAFATSRLYVCDCGFRCFAPGELWDHVNGLHAEIAA